MSLIHDDLPSMDNDDFRWVLLNWGSVMQSLLQPLLA